MTSLGIVTLLAQVRGLPFNGYMGDIVMSLKLRLTRRLSPGAFWLLTLSGLLLIGTSHAMALTVSDLIPTKYVIQENLTVGKTAYVDRGYKYHRVPAFLTGAWYIVTGNNDKAVTGDRHVVFVIDEPARVYVAYDSRYPDSTPTWLSTWAKLPMTSIETMELAGPLAYELYYKDFPAGEVVLGGNIKEGATLANTYLVYVTAAGVEPPPPDPQTVSNMISFAWDYNFDAPQNADLANFRLFMAEESMAYTNEALQVITSSKDNRVTEATGVQVQGLEGTKRYFVLTARDAAGNESAYSNEVNTTLKDLTEPPPPEPPPPDAPDFRIVIEVIREGGTVTTNVLESQ